MAPLPHHRENDLLTVEPQLDVCTAPQAATVLKMRHGFALWQPHSNMEQPRQRSAHASASAASCQSELEARLSALQNALDTAVYPAGATALAQPTRQSKTQCLNILRLC